MESLPIGIVFNPVKVERSELEEALALASGGETPDVRWYETSVEDPGKGMAQHAVDDGCGLVIAAGGDGTVRAVAAALSGTEVALGIVPRGTGNLLARNLTIPLGNVRAAIERALSTESESAIDVGTVQLVDREEEHVFVVMVGFGLDAQMLAETDDDLKAKAGWLAYVDAMGRALASAKIVDASIAFEDDDAVIEPAHTILIGNCGTIQGGMRILPDAFPDDGLLDVLLMGGEGPGALQWFDTVKSYVWDNGIRRALAGDDAAVDTATTRHRQATSVHVTLEEAQEFEIDGEEVGKTREIVATIEPGALRVR